MNAFAPYRVVAEVDGLLVVDKAPGVLTVPHGDGGGRGGAGPGRPCLLDAVRGDGYTATPVHRLDRDTSGLLLLCLDPALRAPLLELFKGRAVGKDYLALVHGRPQPARATVDVPIHDEGATARVDRRGKRAVTRYEVLEDVSSSRGTASLVRCAMETGRHNQVRVHMAHLGHPLLGDDKFGRRRRGGAGPRVRRAMLHAERLALTHPATERALEFRCDPAPDFADLLEALRAG